MTPAAIGAVLPPPVLVLLELLPQAASARATATLPAISRPRLRAHGGMAAGVSRPGRSLVMGVPPAIVPPADVVLPERWELSGCAKLTVPALSLVAGLGGWMVRRPGAAGRFRISSG